MLDDPTDFVALCAPLDNDPLSCLIRNYWPFRSQPYLSAVGSPARAGTVCPRFHHMFALTHFPFRTSACSIEYIDLAPYELYLHMILLYFPH
jgi:hypothetical protein